MELDMIELKPSRKREQILGSEVIVLPTLSVFVTATFAPVCLLRTEVVLLLLLCF